MSNDRVIKSEHKTMGEADLRGAVHEAWKKHGAEGAGQLLGLSADQVRRIGGASNFANGSTASHDELSKALHNLHRLAEAPPAPAWDEAVVRASVTAAFHRLGAMNVGARLGLSAATVNDIMRGAPVRTGDLEHAAVGLAKLDAPAPEAPAAAPPAAPVSPMRRR